MDNDMNTRLPTRRVASVVAVLAGVTLSAHAWAGNYTITDLGTLGGASFAYGLNAFAK